MERSEVYEMIKYIDNLNIYPEHNELISICIDINNISHKTIIYNDFYTIYNSDNYNARPYVFNRIDNTLTTDVDKTQSADIIKEILRLNSIYIPGPCDIKDIMYNIFKIIEETKKDILILTDNVEYHLFTLPNSSLKSILQHDLDVKRMPISAEDEGNIVVYKTKYDNYITVFSDIGSKLYTCEYSFKYVFESTKEKMVVSVSGSGNEETTIYKGKNSITVIK